MDHKGSEEKLVGEKKESQSEDKGKGEDWCLDRTAVNTSL